MTNEEAISIMNVIIHMLEPQYDTDRIEEAVDMAIKALEQTRWIPVSERLPKDGQKVLVTTRSCNFLELDTCIFYHASAFWKHYVIAWMPLPQPYKEG